MRANSHRGFTLAELLVAAIVAVIIIGAISISLSQIGRSREVSRIRNQASMRANSALERIRKEITSLIRSDDLFDTRVIIEADTINTPLGDLDRDDLIVFNTMLRPLTDERFGGQGQDYESQFRVEDDVLGSALWFRTDKVPDRYERGGGTVDPLVDGIVALKLEAYDGTDWFDEWDSDTDGFPWALRVTVTATGRDPGQDEWRDTREMLSLRTVVPIERLEPLYVPEPPPPAAAPEDAAAGMGSGGGMSGGGVAMPGPRGPGAIGRPNQGGGAGQRPPGGTGGGAASGGGGRGRGNGSGTMSGAGSRGGARGGARGGSGGAGGAGRGGQ